MKIPIINNLRTSVLTCGILLSTCNIIPQTKSLNQDVFQKEIAIPPQGTSSDSVLMHAPSPKIEIKNETKFAKCVIDISKNILYKYNDQGEAQKAYLIASGATRTPTDTGVRIVTNIESWPYKKAHPATKRYNNPNAYGPKAIIVEKLDPKTGTQRPTGEFIHGNNNPNSIGKHISQGCIRMDNDVIKELAAVIKKGDIIIIKKGSNND